MTKTLKFPRKVILGGIRETVSMPCFWIRLRYYKTRAQMHRAMKRDHTFHGSDTAGQFSGYTKERVCANGLVETKPLIGDIYLNAEDLAKESGIIPHEIAHAAFAYCRVRRVSLVRVLAPTDGTFVDANEEVFCYFITRVYHVIKDWIDYYDRTKL